MTAVGSLQLILLVAIAGTAAMCGFLAAAVILRKKRRARGYFVLGVLIGLSAAAITRGRYRKLSALGALARATTYRRPPQLSAIGPGLGFSFPSGHRRCGRRRM